VAIDPRVVSVGITINDELHTFESLAISAQGSKYASATQNETIIKIANISKSARDFLATEGSPFNRLRNRKRQKVFIDAGRVSTGTTRIFSGDITLVNLSQPPDIWTEIRAITGQFDKGKIISVSGGAQTSLSALSKKVADSLGLTLQFSATEAQIPNYGFTGAAAKQVERLAELSGPAGVDVFVDDETLVVKDTNAPISGEVRTIDAATGMVGMPEFTDFGVKLRVLFSSRIRVGEQIELDSKFYPATNGRYIIYKLSFDISSRDQPFYYIVEARRAGGIIA